MVRLKIIGLGLLAMGLSMTPMPAAETPQAVPLAANGEAQGAATAAGARQAFDPQASAGDYLKGRLRVTAGRFDLDSSMRKAGTCAALPRGRGALPTSSSWRSGRTTGWW
ncbi:hypothetical protein [Shinella fusca]|uniref:Uncharacterized protein n=1 Tax=Shinella fusca TaxID=544480 RepID=A0A7W7YSE3_9HYPH|nr:hypothetical protein [Shinella fusca]MBB5041486.1 hypothetical protein [Shinella fusca]